MPGGAPAGNQNGARGREWRDAIRVALTDLEDCEGDRRRALRILAGKLIQKAAEGDLNALKELGDRLDGKPAQVISGEDGTPLQIIITATQAGL